MRVERVGRATGAAAGILAMTREAAVIRARDEAEAIRLASDNGYGRFGGKTGIDRFTELRWITIEAQPGPFPI